MEDPTEVERKRKHNESEIRRRSRVNNCFEDLRELLASRIDASASRAQIIAAAVDAVKDADSRLVRLQRHVEYIHRLQQQQQQRTSPPAGFLSVLSGISSSNNNNKPQTAQLSIPWIATQCIFCDGKLCEFADDISNALAGKSTLPASDHSKFPSSSTLSSSSSNNGDSKFSNLKIDVNSTKGVDALQGNEAPSGTLSGSKRKNSLSGKPSDKRLPKRRNSTGDITVGVQLLPIPNFNPSSGSGVVVSSAKNTDQSGPDFAEILTKSVVPMCFLSSEGDMLYWNDSFAMFLWGDADQFKFSKGGHVNKNVSVYSFLDAASTPQVKTLVSKILGSQSGQVFEESGYLPSVKFCSGTVHKREVSAAISLALSRKELDQDNSPSEDKILCIVHQLNPVQQ